MNATAGPITTITLSHSLDPGLTSCLFRAFRFLFPVLDNTESERADSSDTCNYAARYLQQEN
jgi:hypothetical protein